MKTIKFNLAGSTAFFKKPDVNNYAFFSYNNIHKIALLGIIGSIIGLNGYNQQTEAEVFPEFYDKLKDLQVSIVPRSNNGYFIKKIHTFSNNTGFYNMDSNKKPCSFVFKEQWLENVSWDIYISLESENVNISILKKIEDYLLNTKCEFIPYLGKNDHKADITNVELMNLTKRKKQNLIRVHSLFNAAEFEITNNCNLNEQLILMQELLPSKLDKHDNSYEFTQMNFTNVLVTPINNDVSLYSSDKENLYFF